MTILALQAQVVEAGARLVNASLSALPGDYGAMATQLKNLRVDERAFVERNTQIAARATVIGEQCIAAYKVATGMVVVRQARIEGFLSQSVSANIEAVLDSVEEVLKTQVRDAILEEALKAAAQVVGAALLPVNIVSAALDLSKAIRDLRSRHQRGPVDEVLDF
jgi:hypothetical protein